MLGGNCVGLETLWNSLKRKNIKVYKSLLKIVIFSTSILFLEEDVCPQI